MTQPPASEDSAAQLPAAVPAADPGPRAATAPVDLRSGSLLLLAILAGVYTLHWARAVFVPVMLGVMLSVALSPLVAWLERWRLPRLLSASLIVFGSLAGMVYGVYALADDAAAMIETLPEAAQKVRDTLQGGPSEGAAGPLQKVKKAAADLERAAHSAASASAPESSPAEAGVTRVQIEKPEFSLRDYMLSGTLGLAGAVGQTTLVAFITYFLLVSGKTFRLKMVRIAGPTFSRRKITVQALDEITGQIQRYLVVQLFTSLVVGVASWLSFLWIGLNHAEVWGVVAGVLNLIPYIGLILIAGATALVGFLQFGTLEMALVVSGASAVIHAIESYLLTPWLTSHASRMNAVAVFIGVLAWGWLWGIWGLLLGVPILVVVKAVCDRVDDLKPIGELLGS